MEIDFQACSWNVGYYFFSRFKELLETFYFEKNNLFVDSKKKNSILFLFFNRNSYIRISKHKNPFLAITIRHNILYAVFIQPLKNISLVCLHFAYKNHALKLQLPKSVWSERVEESLIHCKNTISFNGKTGNSMDFLVEYVAHAKIKFVSS